jgi:hypothetical protein
MTITPPLASFMPGANGGFQAVATPFVSKMTTYSRFLCQL